MKYSIITTILSISILTTPVAHATNWWDMASDILNAPAEEETQKAEPKGNSISLTSLSNTEIITGLKEALSIGATNVVGQLGTMDGFNKDPKIHIPLPETLKKVDSALSTIGMDTLTDDLELRLNRAAEAATPKAKKLFIDAITKMTIKDAQDILTGSNTAATEYLKRTMGPNLKTEMKPIVTEAVSNAGVIQVYDQVIGQYSQIPFMPDVKANLNEYVVEKAADGIFYYIAKEEAAIRENPVKRTTDVLKKVFSSVQ